VFLTEVPSVIKNSLKIIFAGTPEFAAVALQALLESPHEVLAVYTQPDRPAGRGRQMTASPVKMLASKNKIPVFQPLTLRDAAEQSILSELNADVMVVAAYGLLLPPVVLALPKWGCYNIHTSLLPKWRGAAPIQRAILAGDSTTGVTIIKMDEGLDTGPMLLKKECAINTDDTSATLHDRLAKLGAETILSVLSDLEIYNANAAAQDNSQASYAHKIKKEEARLDWNDSAQACDCKIRAFNPWPIAQTTLQNENIRVWKASVQQAAASKPPGTIVNVAASGIDVATGKNILRLQKIQFPGGKVLAVSDILNSRQRDFAVGKILG
jgi:methionyl-tRNA formyltransferase